MMKGIDQKCFLSSHAAVDDALRSKVDCEKFYILEAKVAAIESAATKHHEVHAFEPTVDVLAIDHHDEFVLSKIGDLESEFDKLRKQLLQMKEQAKNREESNTLLLRKIEDDHRKEILQVKEGAGEREKLLLKKIERLEQLWKDSKQEIAAVKESQERIGGEHQKILSQLESTPKKVSKIQSQLEQLHSTFLSQRELFSTRIQAIDEAESENSLQIVRIRDWCDGLTKIHANTISSEAERTLHMRDDVMSRTKKLSRLLDQVVGTTSDMDLTLDVAKLEYDRSKNGARHRNAERRKPKSKLQQIGAIASSLRSILIPRLAEFRTAADHVGNAISLHLATHSLDGNSDETRNSLSELGVVAENITASKEQVNSAINILSERVATSWDLVNESALQALHKSDMSKLFEEVNRMKISRKKEEKQKVEVPKSNKSRKSLQMDDVHYIVNNALKKLQVSMNDKASKVMVSVVQEQSLAQIDVLRSSLKRFDELQRKSDALEAKLDTQARDMAFTYENLQRVARSGEATEKVIAELKIRLAGASQEIGHVMNMKTVVDSLKRNLLTTESRFFETNRQTDQRLSHMMGSFMTSVKEKIYDSKRESGEAAAAIRQRFLKELRGSLKQMTQQINDVRDQVSQMEPLTKRDTAIIGTKSLSTRCLSCDRPIWGIESNLRETGRETIIDVSKDGGLRGSLLITSPTRPQSSQNDFSPSSSRGGGFRYNTIGARALWVGGTGSPTDLSSRPKSSLGLRKNYVVKR